jgi:hypothetical protein
VFRQHPQVVAGGRAAFPEPFSELRSRRGPLVAEEHVVVKDPRTFWLHALWRESAHKVGFDVAFLTMLRRPDEVAKMRGKSPEEVSTVGMLRAYRERNAPPVEVQEVK